jgi:DNA-binding GntR family transcriptional regulator
VREALRTLEAGALIVTVPRKGIMLAGRDLRDAPQQLSSAAHASFGSLRTCR